MFLPPSAGATGWLGARDQALAGLGAGGEGLLQSTPPFTCPPTTKGKVRGWRGSAQSSQAGEEGQGRGTGNPSTAGGFALLACLSPSSEQP